ncbi:MAG: hypothetical protein BD935_05360 [Marine Group III euryarchaeote CG-Epi1]|mgnify:FL=1|jgi:hypothetical protein|uniref:Uncharacterized protein n=1 Tax=Marine Group III euryarchaeote CG-Epi1 TaxID=1888995 RepID=A0A1J5TGG1_9ARCH|nr:MAG: hypothetical protein BD935_05360 [Marine Group III euryarchaeote CG-Epi1]|tara:strand:- start:51 stop:974 length:924 start_codon:yes stop_codon:yes gene_type:complete
MNFKKIGIGVLAVILLVGGIWGFMISSYDEDLGTNNEFSAKDSVKNLTTEKNNSLFDLSFSKADESLEWSKLRISIDNGTERMDCSKGNFTSNDIGKSKVSPKLSSDSITFTVIIDATSEDEFTYLDMFNLVESNSSNFNLRFSKTDIFLSDNTTGTIIQDKSFEELIDIPEQEFTESSDERLDWYDYKLSTHRVEPEDKIYVIKVNDDYFKIKFTSYYNKDDEARYVSFMIGALGNTEFPALSNPLLVSPAKCTIIEMSKSDFWEENEMLEIYENDFDICNVTCSIKIFITYENISVKGTEVVTLV